MLDVRMIRKRDRPLGFVFHGAQSATEVIEPNAAVKSTTLPSRVNLSQANYSLMGDIMGGLVGGQASGVVVVNTEPGSVADEAGFRPGDVILQVDGAPVNSIRQFVRAVTSTKAQYVIVRVDRFIPAIKSKVNRALLISARIKVSISSGRLKRSPTAGCPLFIAVMLY